MKKIAANAPITMMPSSAMFTTPLRSENMPPSATMSNGMEKNIICRNTKYTTSMALLISVRPLPPCAIAARAATC